MSTELQRLSTALDNDTASYAALQSAILDGAVNRAENTKKAYVPKQIEFRVWKPLINE